MRIPSAFLPRIWPDMRRGILFGLRLGLGLLALPILRANETQTVKAQAVEAQSETSGSHPGAVDPPRLTFTPSGIQNLGSMPIRTHKTATYLIRNISAQPLSISLTDIPKELKVTGTALAGPIPAEASRELQVEFTAPDQPGWFRRRILLKTSDPRQGAYQLPIEATLLPELSVNTTRLKFPSARVHESPAQILTFTRSTQEPFTIHLTSELPPYLEIEQDARTGQREIKLILRPGKIPEGMNQGLETLRFESSVPNQKDWTVYVEWKLAHALELSEPRLVFNGIESKYLIVKRPDHQPFELKEVRIHGEGFSLGPIQDAKPSTEKRLTILRQKPAKASSDATRATLELSVKGDDERITVPLVALP